MESDGAGDGALALEEVEELEYVGRMGGFLCDKSTFYLRLYGDGTLDGHVTQRTKPPLHGRLTTTKKRKHESEGESESVVVGHLQGRWTKRRDGHVCEFRAMKREGHADRQVLVCRAELLADGMARGTWSEGEREDKGSEMETEGDEEHDRVFQWERVEKAEEGKAAIQARKKDPLALYPLMPGVYEFRGFTTYYTGDNRSPHVLKGKKRRAVRQEPPRDECFVTMELKADGTLVGKSREVVYPQSCAITGTWEVGRVRYVLEYQVRDAVGYFQYSGKVSTGIEDEANGDTAGLRVLKGKWKNVDDNMGATPGYAGGRGAFELTCVSARRAIKLEDGESKQEEEEVPSQLGVFTTGSYVLKGKAIDDDGYEYESQLEMELRADGSVHGVCRELVFQQTQTLQGHWSKTALEYELHYVVKKEVGRYFYKGKLDTDGLVLFGAWCNMELLLEDGPASDPMANYRGEKGKFSYAITDVTRRWSHVSHGDFPKAFRDRVRCVLLCSARTHVLPSALWGKIFAFCDPTWFGSA